MNLLRIVAFGSLVRLVLTRRIVLVDGHKPIVLEILHVLVEAVEAAHLGIFHVAIEIEVALNRLVIRQHHDVKRNAKDQVTREIV